MDREHASLVPTKPVPFPYAYKMIIKRYFTYIKVAREQPAYGVLSKGNLEVRSFFSLFVETRVTTTLIYLLIYEYSFANPF